MVQKKSKGKEWQWEISYEESDEGQLGNLPLIHVPPEEEMPKFLMVWEARDTGELEPGLSGEEVPIVEWELRQYAHMDVLRNKLSAEDYDKVRLALGLQPLKEAVKQGQSISQRVRDNIAQKELESLGKKM